MNEVASILSMYINYSDALNGKCKFLPDEVLAKNTTEIKLAQDAVADIKKAGYNVSLEEIDTTNDYQIIIKLQK